MVNGKVGGTEGCRERRTGWRCQEVGKKKAIGSMGKGLYCRQIEMP